MKLKKTEIVILIYIFITELLLILSYQKENLSYFLINILLSFIIIFTAKTDKSSLKPNFFRIIYPLFLLSFFYGETSILNHIFFKKNLDSFFMNIDQKIFGFQPALLFAKKYPFPWLNNILYFSYFFFLLMPILTGIIFYFYKKDFFEKAIFTIVTSFIIYYLIFIILPVVGPQFYWDKKISTIPAAGIFGKLVKFIQKYGEHPTGAFPSSHVGISIIITYLFYKKMKPLFYSLLPISFLILFATVYIRAHYAIDVIAGIISSFIIFQFTQFLWDKLTFVYNTNSLFVLKNKLKKLLMFTTK